VEPDATPPKLWPYRSPSEVGVLDLDSIRRSVSDMSRIATPIRQIDSKTTQAAKAATAR
jgi:hypothetical protein